MNRRVSTDVMSWKRRELAAPDSRAPLLLRRMACSSPANKLIRITLSALHHKLHLSDGNTGCKLCKTEGASRITCHITLISPLTA